MLFSFWEALRCFVIRVPEYLARRSLDPLHLLGEGSRPGNLNFSERRMKTGLVGKRERRPPRTLGTVKGRNGGIEPTEIN
jgi:hypothetical protein